MIRGFAVGVWLASVACLWIAQERDDEFDALADDLIATWTVCPSSGCTSQRIDLGGTELNWT